MTKDTKITLDSDIMEVFSKDLSMQENPGLRKSLEAYLEHCGAKTFRNLIDKTYKHYDTYLKFEKNIWFAALKMRCESLGIISEDKKWTLESQNPLQELEEKIIAMYERHGEDFCVGWIDKTFHRRLQHQCVNELRIFIHLKKVLAEIKWKEWTNCRILEILRETKWEELI